MKLLQLALTLAEVIFTLTKIFLETLVRNLHFVEVTTSFKQLLCGLLVRFLQCWARECIQL